MSLKRIIEKLRNSPKYKAASAAWLMEHPHCEVWLEAGIKVRATQIHHPYKWSYRSPAIYMDFDHNGAQAVSLRGHYARHHGLVPCKGCKKKLVPYENPYCQACWMKKHPQIAAKLDADNRLKQDGKNRRKREKRAAEKAVKT